LEYGSAYRRFASRLLKPYRNALNADAEGRASDAIRLVFGLLHRIQIAMAPCWGGSGVFSNTFDGVRQDRSGTCSERRAAERLDRARRAMGRVYAHLR